MPRYVNTGRSEAPLMIKLRIHNLNMKIQPPFKQKQLTQRTGFTKGFLIEIKIKITVRIWKRYRHYWPFVRGICMSPVVSPHKWPCTEVWFFAVVNPNKLLNKESSYCWFGTPGRSCDVNVLYYENYRFSFAIWKWWFSSQNLKCPVWYRALNVLLTRTSCCIKSRIAAIERPWRSYDVLT